MLSRTPRNRCLTSLLVASAASLASCDRGPSAPAPVARVEPAPPQAPAHDDELAALTLFEQTRRAEADFAALPPSNVALGPDPYRIAALGDRRFLGLLRGDSAVVLLDERGRELARRPAPGSPSGLALTADGDVLVVGDNARELARYRRRGDQLERTASLAIDAIGLRDVAVAADGKTAYVVEEHDGRLLAVALDRPRGAGVRELGRCHGPIQVATLAGHVAINCLLDHAIEIRRPGGGEVVRIRHDGPIWRFALHREADGGLIIAAGGVEDHPLERADGGFGYIDSYLFVYRLAPGAAEPVRLATINSSALDVVTPKWLAIAPAGEGPRLAGAAGLAVTMAGYASPSLVTLTWPGEIAGEPTVTTAALLPGTAAAALAGDGTLVAANPLLDAWIVARSGEPEVVGLDSVGSARLPLSRIGELLFFTTMMAPWSSTEGKRSRFTCETCHHEGYIDGRVHYTGRDKVHAATRPLYGLFNNQPYFSRALDKTMTDMVHAEFRVANRHNGRDPWFGLTRADVPWLDRVAAAFGAERIPAELSPELLREAFMTFLMDFTHRSNPAADHAQFTARERAGAAVFRERCASCHAARLIADQPDSEVPFERWEALVLSPAGPLVWSNAAYEKTGVEPYVHPSGARVPTLRRLYKKWPYFTSGSARSLGELLDRYAWTPAAAFHDAAPAGASRLTEDDKATLRAFLDLL